MAEQDSMGRFRTAAKSKTQEVAPPPKKNRGRKRGGRPFVNADMEWTLLLLDTYKQATALAYILLGTKARVQGQYKADECVVSCDVWKEFHFEKSTWYRVLDQLREAGAIATEALPGDTVRVVVSSDPTKPATIENTEEESA
jgi:hypothetical protein